MQLSEKIHALLQAYNAFSTRKKMVKYPETLYEPISYALSIPAKRVRPLACLLAYDMFSKDWETALPLAYSFEHFHNFTLVHDDIMDNAPLRRGVESVFNKFGLNQALLSGDLMLLQCYEMLLQADLNNKNEILRCFTQTAIEVCEGQQMDIDFETKTQVLRTDYIQMIQFKTAVLLAACLQCGALAANASRTDAEYLYEYGLKIGTIFQIKDDVIDVFGENSSGKIKAGDIVQNKKTMLYIIASERCDSLQQKRLSDYYTSASISNESKIEGVIEIFNAVQVREVVENLLKAYQREADEILSKINLPDASKAELHAFSEGLLQRIK